MRAPLPKRPAILVGLALAMAAGSAAAESTDGSSSPRLEAISLTALPGGTLHSTAELRIRTSGPPDFSLFRLQNPTRLVIDVREAEVGTPVLPDRPPRDSLVSTVTTTQFRGRGGTVARVVVVMRGEIEFDAVARGQEVIVTARRTGEQAAAPAASPAPAKADEEAAPAEAASDTPVVEITGEEETPEAKASRLLGISAKERAGGTLLDILTDGQVEKYEIEEVDDPPRLVIDLFSVKAKKGMDRELAAPALKRARVGLHHDKTRVVIDGQPGKLLPHYDVASTPEGLRLMFDGVTREAAVVTSITGLDVVDKTGFIRLQLATSGPVSVRTVGNAPRTKTIALDAVAIHPELITRRAVERGPVQAVEIVPGERDGTFHIALHVNDDVEHSVWQKDGSLFWDVRRRADTAPVAQGGDQPQPRAAGYAHTAAMASHEGTAARAYKGKKITIDLQEADIVNVIRLLGDVSGKNVVVGEDVAGKVTIKLKNVPWDQALDVILRTKQLGKEVRGGIIRIAKQEQLNAERAARLQLQEDAVKKQPTTVRLIPVNYAVASELVPQIKELLSERGRVTQDERTNVIIVEDVRDNLDQAQNLVKTLDTQTPLVLIEARMVEASTSFSRSLGIQWGGGFFLSQRGGNQTGLIFPNNVGIAGGAQNPNEFQQPQSGVFSPTNYAVNLPAANTNTAVGMNLGAIGNYGFLNARLSAAETNGEAKIISSPKVTTLNNKKASITQGVSIPVVVTTQNQIQTSTVEANLELEVTPHVTADGSILMKLVVSNDQPGLAPPGVVPQINRKAVDTEILVRDGDTAVIGGIYTRSFREQYAQTPFLGSIPVLGWLFKSYQADDQRDEMLVFLTPRIVNRSP